MIKKILAISGSTRKSSSNLNLIKAISELGSEKFEIIVFDRLSDIPHFNPDLDIVPAPGKVQDFRNMLRSADGVLICTPEYAMGVPGTLKNAIDWTVSSMEFSRKPVALITASLSGEAAHKSLLGTLLIIESRISDDTQLLISGIKAKVNEKAEITDQTTLNLVNKLIKSFHEIMLSDKIPTLLPPKLGSAGCL